MSPSFAATPTAPPPTQMAGVPKIAKVKSDPVKLKDIQVKNNDMGIKCIDSTTDVSGWLKRQN